MKALARIFLVVMVLGISTSVMAQFKFGVGGGVNYAGFVGSDVSEGKSITGFNGGIMTEIKLPVKIGFEMDILFSTKGASDKFDPTFPAIDYKLTYIDIPLVLKLYMAKVISFQLGAQYSMLLGANINGDDFKDQLNPGDMSAVVGLGVDVSKLHLSCRYNYGLTSIDKGGADIKNSMLTLTVGFWLKK